MKKQILLRGLSSFPVGIAIGYIFTILISLAWGDGNYYPCVPILVETVGSELGAVILQAVLCGFLGSAFGACSVIWEIESWSIAKQSGVYFFITSLFMMPIAYITGWMRHSLMGFISYFGIFAGIFLLVWLIQFFGWKRKINKINAHLK